MGDRYYYDDRDDRRRRRSYDEQDYYYTTERTPRDRYYERVAAVDRAEDQWRRMPAREKEMALVLADDIDTAARNAERGEIVQYRRERQRRGRDDRSDDDGYRRRHRSSSDRRSPSRDRHRDRNGKDDPKGRCWYSHKERKDANIIERSFDSSYDGLIAAAAGAALGAMTANRFAGDGGNRKLKVGGAAVAGALSFNAAENWYRVFIEDEEEIKDKVKKKAREKLRV